MVTPSFPAVPGQRITLEPIADSDVDVGRPQLRVDGQLLALNELGQAIFIAQRPGRYEVESEVTDIEGRTTKITRAIFVRDPADVDAPTIYIHEITPPIISDPRLLSIDIGDANLAEYFIDLVPVGGGSSIRIGQGVDNVCHQTTLDPRRYVNGFYRLQVTARDLGGLETVSFANIEINSTTKIGTLERSVTDLTVSLDGFQIPLTRFHSSMTTGQTSSTFVNTVDVQGVSFGDAWTLPLVNPQVAIQPNAEVSKAFAEPLRHGDRLYLTLPDGRRVGFTFSPIESMEGDVRAFRPKWIADQGVDWDLKSFDKLIQRPGSDLGYYVLGNGLPYNLSLDPGSARPTSTLTLIAPNGIQYGYRFVADTAAGPRFNLERILSSDNTRSLRWTDSGLTASQGDRLSIIRDHEGRIVEYVGPAGEHWIYRYGEHGQLTGAIDFQTGERTFYEYDELNRLTTLAHSNRGGEVFRYDPDDGRLLANETSRSHLGGTRQFTGTAFNDSLLPSGSRHLTFTITESELRSSPTGKVSLGIELRSGDFHPTAASIMGLTPSVAQRVDGASWSLHTIQQAGTYTILVNRQDAQSVVGDFSIQIYLAGDLNEDRQIDLADQVAFDQADGSTTLDPNYRLLADLDRNGRVDSQDRSALLSSFGFVAIGRPSYWRCPQSLVWLTNLNLLQPRLWSTISKMT